MTYAGSHGFDVDTPEGPAALGPARDRFLPALDAAERDLRARTRELPGVFVERKRSSVALHHRLAPPDCAALAAEAFWDVRASRPELRAIAGKRVFELLPAIEWDKGRAVLALAERFRKDGGDFVPLYLGDDTTDEDAFRAVRDAGVGIAVLEAPRPTAARYRLASVEEVRRFLERLAERLGA
ncbi:MAG: trehalose-phosphatase [Planctomycetota bacterium]